MDWEVQSKVKEITSACGAENVVVVLGVCDPEAAKTYAETVTVGDPTFVGPLAGVPLGLLVYHILEPEVMERIGPPLRERLEALRASEKAMSAADVVRKVRERSGRRGP
jgi:betaine reductase